MSGGADEGGSCDGGLIFSHSLLAVVPSLDSDGSEATGFCIFALCPVILSGPASTVLQSTLSDARGLFEPRYLLTCTFCIVFFSGVVSVRWWSAPCFRWGVSQRLSALRSKSSQLKSFGTEKRQEQETGFDKTKDIQTQKPKVVATRIQTQENIRRKKIERGIEKKDT